VSGLNHVLSICIGLSFGVNAISGDGVMGMNDFYNDDYSQFFLNVILKNNYHIVQFGE
jgi:hypothetical protein